ncbi:MAG: polyketide synthase, partial [Oscillochloridaceae bacterium umkhey_bin13]
KRVQILGAMQERMPSLPAFKPETLAELRTLGQVLDHVRPHLVGGQGMGDGGWGSNGNANAIVSGAGAQQSAHSAIGSPSNSLTAAPTTNPVATPIAYANPPAAIPGAERSVPRLIALPPPDALECALPAGACCVITDDGSGTAAALAQALQTQGWPAVVLRLPANMVPNQAPLPATISRVGLTDASEAQLEQALASIAASYGPIAAFIHLHPRSPAPTLLDPTDAAIVRHVFLAARMLGPSLRAAAEQGRSAFLTVTRMDGALGTAQRNDYSAVPGGLAGLTKTLRHEWQHVFCRAIDLNPGLDAAQAASLIVAELYDPDQLLAEVGYTASGRVTLLGAAGDL